MGQPITRGLEDLWKTGMVEGLRSSFGRLERQSSTWVSSSARSVRSRTVDLEAEDAADLGTRTATSFYGIDLHVTRLATPVSVLGFGRLRRLTGERITASAIALSRKVETVRRQDQEPPRVLSRSCRRDRGAARDVSFCGSLVTRAAGRQVCVRGSEVVGTVH